MSTESHTESATTPHHTASQQSSEPAKKEQIDPTLAQCQQELTTARQEAAQNKDKFLRISADFENLKKRTEKEKAQWTTIAQQTILLDLLDIVDDFDRALESARKSEDHEALTAWLIGFELTYKTLSKLLEKYGVQEIKDHEIFNPAHHEAVMHVDSAEHISGSIVAVLQKGFTLKGIVLRPAKVSVAK